MVTASVFGVVAVFLALQVWAHKSATETSNGILIVSKDNMREYLIAVLSSNKGSLRVKGLSDSDLIEIYDVSVEVMRMNKELIKDHGKKGTFSFFSRKMLYEADS